MHLVNVEMYSCLERTRIFKRLLYVSFIYLTVYLLHVTHTNVHIYAQTRFTKFYDYQFIVSVVFTMWVETSERQQTLLSSS